MLMFPKIKESLIIEEIGNEALIYDKETDKAHCLNPETYVVFKQCNGHHTIKTIAKKLDITEEKVWEKIFSIQRANLFQDSYKLRKELSRRRMLFFGLAGIISITAPTKAEAASTCGQSGTKCVGAPTAGGCCTSHLCIAGKCT